MEQEMPDFSAPGRRISEVKCLEELWKRKFYDQVLLKKIRCKTGVEGAYVSFAIYNGQEVSSTRFPHTGAIGWKTVNGAWIFLCGSALISDRFMLTAAHCATSTDARVADPSPKIVRLGSNNILNSNNYGKKPIDVNIKNFIIHENYRHPFKQFDIALIELKVKVPFTVYTNPSCVWPNDHEELFGKAYEAGWGVVQSDKIPLNAKDVPQYEIADLDLIDSKTCEEKIKSLNTPESYQISQQICATYSGNDTCKVDSGGPLMTLIRNPGFSDFTVHYITGVEVESYGCHSPTYPNIYTRVSSFIDWIEEIVWPDEEEVREYLTEKKFTSIYGPV
ncbi:serine protease snake-like [Battus philenor]|uniref:serine protease snake-like n=1 Tax=Battus philenor TaxID=42288 RepID=UPI0035CFFFF0